MIVTSDIETYTNTIDEFLPGCAGHLTVYALCAGHITMYIMCWSFNTSARPEVRGTADVGWRSLKPLPINPPRTHSRLYHHMCLRTDGR